MSDLAYLDPTPTVGLGSSLKLIVGPQQKLLSLQEAKDHLRIDIDDENAELAALVDAATKAVEEDTHRALITQTWEQAIDRFPCGTDPIPLMKGPLQSVTSITSYDSSDVSAVMSPSAYFVNSYRVPALVCLKSGQTWPTGLRTHLAGVIKFICGHGDAAENVDADLKMAIKLQLKPIYQRRPMDEDECRAYDHFISPWVVHFVGD